MSDRILKGSIPVDDAWHVGPSSPLHWQVQGEPDSVQVWFSEQFEQDHGDMVQVMDASSTEYRIYGTGQPVEEDAEYVATVLTSEGQLVWHIFRRGLST